MKKVIGFLSNSKSVGMDAAEAFLFDDNATELEINHTIHLHAVEHAGSFYSVVGDEVSDEEYDENYNEYIREEEVDSYWETYNGEEHDGKRAGGGSFEEDFEYLMR